ncbi:hypothetical protein LINPERHAP1_LOCUS24446 [Linum perenne]
MIDTFSIKCFKHFSCMYYPFMQGWLVEVYGWNYVLCVCISVYLIVAYINIINGSSKVGNHNISMRIVHDEHSTNA